MHRRIICAAVAAVALAACGGMNTSVNSDGGGGTGGGAGAGGGTGGGGGSSVAGDGMPCDVAQIISSNCLSCHGPTLSGGAPVHLVTRADFLAQSPQWPGQTVGQRVVARMAMTTAPMPPAPNSPVSSADQTIVSNWVNAGMPADSCAFDAGSTQPVCTSNVTVPYNDGAIDGTSTMDPGYACISCHTQNGGPTFYAAGTVYPTVHEPDLCNGFNGNTNPDIEVHIVGSDNADTHVVKPNRAGNFYWEPWQGNIPFPITAYVKNTTTGAVRAMTTPQTSGDCNSCHTEQGTSSAPGRIYVP